MLDPFDKRKRGKQYNILFIPHIYEVLVDHRGTRWDQCGQDENVQLYGYLRSHNFSILPKKRIPIGIKSFQRYLVCYPADLQSRSNFGYDFAANCLLLAPTVCILGSADPEGLNIRQGSARAHLPVARQPANQAAGSPSWSSSSGCRANPLYFCTRL